MFGRVVKPPPQAPKSKLLAGILLIGAVLCSLGTGFFMGARRRLQACNICYRCNPCKSTRRSAAARPSIELTPAETRLERVMR